MSGKTFRANIHAQPDLFAEVPPEAASSRSVDLTTPAANHDATSWRECGRGTYREADMSSSELQDTNFSVQPKRASHLLDVRAAAAWLGLSKSTLDKMRCYGVGPRFIRATGRAVRYDPADLAAFAEGRRQSRTTDELPA